ncbi:J domain-containing protein [Vineibacter terrae]|nr:J domain-containing protein [Vineibacter terrae]
MASDVRVEGRVCEYPGCTAAGEFRAPKSRDKLHQYRWFCLEHVREYNAKWDFYAGMNEIEIEAQIRADQTWRRPTWKVGTRTGRQSQDPFESLLDPYDILADSDVIGTAGRRPAAQANNLTPAEQQALSILDLTWPQTLDSLKVRYKELAKRHHPDANGGSKDAEERLKLINRAYSTLRQSPHFAT